MSAEDQGNTPAQAAFWRIDEETGQVVDIESYD